jgi:Na+(H+)/acetate symporter ActP
MPVSLRGTGLIVFKDRNRDGVIQYSGKADMNELTVDRGIMGLANPEIARLPAWVVALVAAGGLAAALSTAAGLLLVISASVSHDLLKSVMGKTCPKRNRDHRLVFKFMVAITVSCFTPPPPLDVQSIVEDIRSPSGARDI